eukprot:gene3979-4980_t
MDLQGGGGDNPFDNLRNHPQFQLLRQAIQRNPQVIQELLQQLNETNPQLARQISENPQEFLRIFQEEGGSGSGPRTMTIQVTPEESAAIERLQLLTGMDKSEVIEAYFACDKNEDLTASYLFERSENPDEN